MRPSPEIMRTAKHCYLTTSDGAIKATIDGAVRERLIARISLLQGTWIDDVIDGLPSRGLRLTARYSIDGDGLSVPINVGDHFWFKGIV